MKHRFDQRKLGGLAIAILMSIAMPAAAEDAADKEQTEETRDTSSVVTRIIYAPKDVGAPTVTVSGGVRGDDRTPTVRVLSPPTLTPVFTPQPTLYWFMSPSSPTLVRVTVIDEDPTRPTILFETQLGPTDKPGIYSLSLAEQGLSLDRTALYSWSVALETPADSYSEQPVASTFFERVDEAPEISGTADMPPLERSQQLAASGYWYEAFDQISQGIGSDDASTPWMEIRANLLEQVGLDDVAAFERARMSQ